jgi:hypothetical protein
MRYHLSVFFILLFAPFSATAQARKSASDDDSNKIWTFQANIGWQQSILLEVGVSRLWLKNLGSRRSSGDFIRPIRLPNVFCGVHTHLGGYYDFSSQRFLLGAHLGGDYYYMPNPNNFLGVAARLSTSIYNHVSNPDGVDIRITPQLGITAFSIFSVFYGYSIPILSDPIAAIARHRITISCSIPLND